MILFGQLEQIEGISQFTNFLSTGGRWTTNVEHNGKPSFFLLRN